MLLKQQQQQQQQTECKQPNITKKTTIAIIIGTAQLNWQKSLKIRASRWWWWFIDWTIEWGEWIYSGRAFHKAKTIHIQWRFFSLYMCSVVVVVVVFYLGTTSKQCDRKKNSCIEVRKKYHTICIYTRHTLVTWSRIYTCECIMRNAFLKKLKLNCKLHEIRTKFRIITVIMIQIIIVNCVVSTKLYARHNSQRLRWALGMMDLWALLLKLFLLFLIDLEFKRKEF